VLFVFLVNIPFGNLRARAPRFSRIWFLAVHAPVPLVFGFRFLLGVGWRLPLFPLFAGAYFAGQFLGGRSHRSRIPGSEGPDPGAE